ncbi:hypothetical protein T492DRAFT_1039506 [Pavlovales sp. CCMP2436]|nr:hypothetical protein T492DRAFT_1039506 [Pavlovales sp. CCMP2436]
MAELEALFDKSEAALVEAQAKSAGLSVQMHAASAEASALRGMRPLLEEAEENVRVLMAEVQRVEADLEQAVTRARVNAFRLYATTADVWTTTEAKQAELKPSIRAAGQSQSVPAEVCFGQAVPNQSNIATPIRKQPVELRKPSSYSYARQSNDAHRRAVDIGLDMLKASPAKRLPLDALHRATPSSLLRKSTGPSKTDSPAPSTVLKLGSALFR